MRSKLFVYMTVILFGVLVIVGCTNVKPSPTLMPTSTATSTATPTPIPFNEINLDALLVQPGDLPPGVTGSQIRTTPPAMFDGIASPDYEIYQLFERQGKQMGGVAVFVYEDMSKVEEAYQFILKGMGGEDGTTPASIGDQSAFMTITLPFSDEIMTDLVWKHCHSVVHVRISATPEAAISYGERLDKRISQITCR